MAKARLCLSKTTAVATSLLRCVTGGFGTVQIVAAPQKVLLDLQSRAYNTVGLLHQDHAAALLPLDDARRLLVELTAAVAQSEALAPSPAPTWGDETSRHVVLAAARRRHPNRKRSPVAA